MIAVGSPWPPEIDGKGNHPRSGSGFWSGVREAMTPGSQAPMSSMAALWFATSPAELPAPCCAAVVRKPLLKGFVPANVARSWPAFSQHGSVNVLVAAALFSVSALHSRSENQKNQGAAGQASFAPRAIGSIPAALSFVTAAFRSSIVFGVAVIPAFVKRSLL